MTDTAIRPSKAPAGFGVRLRVQYRLTPWWVKVLVVYVLARIVTAVFLLILASVQGPNPWTGAHPGYFDFSSIWDGRWYDIVAGWGYPSELPLKSDGAIDQNAWAFLPAYPYLVSALMFVTQLPWAPVAVFVSLGFGLGAALLFYRMMHLRLSGSTSLYAVALFCVAPVAPLMQLAYAESMYMFFLVWALYLLMRRRYWAMIVPITVMAFTRPSGLAFALALGLHVVYRWFRRRKDGYSLRDAVASVSVTVYALIAGLAWPAIAGLATGFWSAYTDTELSWRSDYIGQANLMPFTPWFEAVHWWFTDWLNIPTWIGYTALVALILVFVLWLLMPSVRRLGVDLRLWLASYGLYLLAVFFPQSSTFRLLMPMFPLFGAIAQPKSRVYRIGMVVLSIALQLVWLLAFWGVDGLDWTPP